MYADRQKQITGRRVELCPGACALPLSLCPGCNLIFFLPRRVSHITVRHHPLRCLQNSVCGGIDQNLTPGQFQKLARCYLKNASLAVLLGQKAVCIQKDLCAVCFFGRLLCILFQPGCQRARYKSSNKHDHKSDHVSRVIYTKIEQRLREQVIEYDNARSRSHDTRCGTAGKHGCQSHAQNIQRNDVGILESCSLKEQPQQSGRAKQRSCFQNIFQNISL